jgi:hypothetical protein
MKAPPGNLVLFQLPFAVLMLVWVLALRPGTCNTNQSAYCFRQTGRLTGIHVVHLSKKGVQIENLHTHIGMVSAAPDWKLCIYNKAKGKYYVIQDASTFKGSLYNRFFRTAGGDFENFSWKRSNTQPFHGLSADRFVGEDPNAEKHTIRGLVSDSTIKFADYTVAHDDIVPTRIADAVCRFYSVPSLHKLPFQYLYSPDRKTLLLGLTTTAFERVPDSAGLYVYPKGLKLASDEQEVLMGEL